KLDSLFPDDSYIDMGEIDVGRKDVHSLEGPAALQRSLIPITTHDTGFIQYMDSGIWHLAVYNDGKETETVSFLTTAIGETEYHKIRTSVGCCHATEKGVERS
ncbi:hypothetical protein GOODEAATRI_016399, partial [Goodea atripinnis]